MGIYGIGNWAAIKRDPMFMRPVRSLSADPVRTDSKLYLSHTLLLSVSAAQLKERTNEQLKDKFRNIERRRRLQRAAEQQDKATV